MTWYVHVFLQLLIQSDKLTRCGFSLRRYLIKCDRYRPSPKLWIQANFLSHACLLALYTFLLPLFNHALLPLKSLQKWT